MILNYTIGLESVNESLVSIRPELALGGGFLVLILVELFMGNNDKVKLKELIFFCTIIFALLLNIEEIRLSHIIGRDTDYSLGFYGSVILNSFGITIRVLLYIAAILTLVFQMLYVGNKDKQGEFYILFIGLVLGLSVLSKANNYLVFYLGLELASLTSYVLTSVRFHGKGAEGSIKYLLYGAFSSAIMLFGISLIYGALGHLNFQYNTVFFIEGKFFIIGIVMFLGGVLFKLSAFPFHFWVADVYESAPLSIVTFFSVAPKLVILAPLVLICRSSYSQFYDMPVNWHELLAVIALLTITIGNVLALVQQNVKRLLAYSSIAHAGYLLVGIVMMKEQGFDAVLIYGFMYLLANYGVFYASGQFIKIAKSTDVKDWKGLGKKYPYISILLLMCLVSLIGLPPTGGFWGKLTVFSSIWNQVDDYAIINILFIFGLLNSVIALFYYLRIPYMLFMKESKENIKSTHFVGMGSKLFITLLGLSVIVLFFGANWVIDLVQIFK